MSTHDGVQNVPSAARLHVGQLPVVIAPGQPHPEEQLLARRTQRYPPPVSVHSNSQIPVHPPSRVVVVEDVDVEVDDVLVEVEVVEVLVEVVDVLVDVDVVDVLVDEVDVDVEVVLVDVDVDDVLVDVVVVVQSGLFDTPLTDPR